MGAASGKGAYALLKYGDAQATSSPKLNQPPAEFGGRILSYNQLAALDPAPQTSAPERAFYITLSGGMMSYQWTINGQAYPNADPFEIRAGEKVRLKMTNRSMMPHPMHLHGHSYRILHKNAGNAAPFKDTMIVNHMETVEVEFMADNPGDWAFHCHNAFHLETGMMRVFKYV